MKDYKEGEKKVKKELCFLEATSTNLVHDLTGGEDAHTVNCPAKLLAYSTDLMCQGLSDKDFEHIYGQHFVEKCEDLLHHDPLLLEMRKDKMLHVGGHTRKDAGKLFSRPLTAELAAELAPPLVRGAVWNLGRARKLEYEKAGNASDAVQQDVETKFLKAVNEAASTVKNIILTPIWPAGVPREVDKSVIEAVSAASVEYKPKFPQAQGPMQRTARKAAAATAKAAPAKAAPAKAAAGKAAPAKAVAP